MVKTLKTKQLQNDQKQTIKVYTTFLHKLLRNKRYKLASRGKTFIPIRLADMEYSKANVGEPLLFTLELARLILFEIKRFCLRSAFFMCIV